MIFTEIKTTNATHFIFKGDIMLKHDAKRASKAGSKEKNENTFSFNIERMKDRVASKTVYKPVGLTGTALTDWLMSH